MKRLIFLFSLGLLVSMQGQAQFSIPDTAFAAKLQQIVPNAMNGNVLDTNHVDVTSLTTMVVNNTMIVDLDGVQFFKNLHTLYCGSTFISNLSNLPPTILDLQTTGSPINSFSDLPPHLHTFFCGGGTYSTLPDLPSSLRFFSFSSNNIVALPTLPDSLYYLAFSGTQLPVFSPLPAGLQQLHIIGTSLTSLPFSIPNSVKNIKISGNPQLITLPSLPDSLLTLDCKQNALQTLPDLVDGLWMLECGFNQLECLPTLPSSLTILRCENNQITCLPNFPLDLPPFGSSLGANSNLGFSPIVCSPSDDCFPDEVVAGFVFDDLNGNSVRDVNEPGIGNAAVVSQPGNNITGTDNFGNFSLPIQFGPYSAQGLPLMYRMITTPPYAGFMVPGVVDTANSIGYQPIPGIFDLVVNIQSSVTRPGFDNNVWLEVKNIGTEPATATIDLDFDADQTFVSSTVTPASQTGTNVNWSVSMNPGDVWNASVTLNTAASIPLGTNINHLFAAIPASADTTPADNSTSWNDIVVGSYDPNDKTASDSVLTPTQVMNGEWIEYLIRFQNTGTFLAEHVRITDTLSTDLQWGTLEYISASHDNYWYLSNGTLVFQFDNIQLPDSNANEPDSHGFVKFRIKPDPNLTVGDAITNIANIYFDFNEPEITDPSVVLIDVSSGVAAATSNEVLLYPNPSNDELTIRSEQIISQLAIYSNDGRLLRSESVNARSYLINVSNMEQGMYLLEIVTNTGRGTRRFIVQK